MNVELVRRRDEITQRLWAVEDAHPDEDASEVIRAAGDASKDLAELVRDIGDNPDLLEAGKTWKYLGDAWYLSAGRKDQTSLCEAMSAYRQAETFLEPDDAGVEAESADWIEAQDEAGATRQRTR